MAERHLDGPGSFVMWVSVHNCRNYDDNIGLTVLAFVLPALIAGAYGIVTEFELPFRVFRRYAVYGYSRCLLLNVLVFLIAWMIS
ncbi:MAG: hypothetical protein LBU24_05660 [Methanocalculaceae archaeon]|jgi:hypothetical protein|nr:hypothetical protein [Methanocalculaceae archaeon]